ncbi:MAG TPA: GIY-YIG nuclease family protein, partial [Anaerolineae bacterium]
MLICLLAEPQYCDSIVVMMTLVECLAQIRTKPGKVYVYTLHRPDGAPFYVGVGQRKRIAWHAFECNTRSKSRKINIIRKLKRNGSEVGYSLVAWFDDWSAAADEERRLINEIGRLDLGTGPLANMTSGGDGTPNPSDEVRAVLSSTSKRAWGRAEYRAFQRENLSRNWADPAARAQRIESLRKSWNEARRNSKAESQSSKWKDSEFREAQSRRIRNAVQTPGHRERQRSLTKDRMDRMDAVARQRASDGLKVRWQDDCYRQRMKKNSAALWASATHRSRVAESMRRR